MSKYKCPDCFEELEDYKDFFYCTKCDERWARSMIINLEGEIEEFDLEENGGETFK